MNRTQVPISKKKLKEQFDVIADSITQSQELLKLFAFYLVIKPVVDRYGWTIDWGMGGVDFETRDGRTLIPYDPIYQVKTLNKMADKLADLMEPVLGHTKAGYLWDVMCGLGKYNRYHKDTGLQFITGE